MADDIGTDLNQGAEFARGLTADERKSDAYNALNKVYGPVVANDPAQALQVQEYAQRNVTNPIAVQQAQATLTGTGLDNSGKAENNNFLVQDHPLQLQHQSLVNTGQADTNAQTEQTTNFAAQDQPLNLQQKAATIRSTNANTAQSYAAAGASNAETATRKFALNTAEGQQLRTTAMGIIAGLTDTIQQGGDVGASFDKFAPQIAQFEGLSPNSPAMQAFRAKFVADPVNTANSLTDAVHGADQEAMASKFAGKGGAGAAALLKAQGQVADRVNAMKAIADRTEDIPNLMDQAQGFVKQMVSNPIARKARAEIPGTAEYNYVQLLEHRVQPNLALTDLQNMKANGLSMGKVSNMELKLSGQAYVNTDLGLDAATIVSNLQRVKSLYSRINSNMNDDISRISKSAGAGGSANGHITGPAKAIPAGISPADIQAELARRGNK